MEEERTCIKCKQKFIAYHEYDEYCDDCWAEERDQFEDIFTLL